MSWPSFGYGFAAAWAWLLAATAAGALTGRFLRKRPARAASPPPAPASPGAGAPRPAPAPAPATGPRLLMSSRFYSDGVVFVDDHIKRTTTRFDPPPDDSRDWDAALRRLTDACD